LGHTPADLQNASLVPQREPNVAVQAQRADSMPATERHQEILSVPSAGILMESSERVRIPAFLGQSSSSAVVAELNSSLGIDDASATSLHVPRVQSVPVVSIKQGVEVLSYFADIEWTRQLLDRCFESGDRQGFLIYRPIYYAWLEGLLPLINEATSTNTLAKLSATVWKNTQRPLLVDGATSAIDWARRATGHDLRWESIGLLLSLFGMLFGFLPVTDPMLRSDPKVGRLELLSQHLHLVDMCLDLSKTSRNDLVTILLYDRMLLVAFLRGDTSIETWTSLSATCDAAVLSGMHLEKRVDTRTPFFLCELRIRLFLMCYSMVSIHPT
jgi:hypothetical protein